MGETLKSPEASEQSNPVAQEIGFVRRAINRTVNGVNDAVEVGGTATAYTVGRTARTIKKSASNLMQGARGGPYGQAA